MLPKKPIAANKSIAHTIMFWYVSIIIPPYSTLVTRNIGFSNLVLKTLFSITEI